MVTPIIGPPGALNRIPVGSVRRRKRAGEQNSQHLYYFSLAMNIVFVKKIIAGIMPVNLQTTVYN
jgi:hypothetical protein